MYEMKLNSKYFYFILNGTKKIEIRLNDDKRKKLKIEDSIKFKNLNNLDISFEVKIIDLIKYNSFKELINGYNISELASLEMTKEELLEDLYKIYTKEEELKYGALAIRFELFK